MTLLFDESLSPRLVELLRDLFPESESALRNGLAGDSGVCLRRRVCPRLDGQRFRTANGPIQRGERRHSPFIYSDKGISDPPPAIPPGDAFEYPNADQLISFGPRATICTHLFRLRSTTPSHSCGPLPSNADALYRKLLPRLVIEASRLSIPELLRTSRANLF